MSKNTEFAISETFWTATRQNLMQAMKHKHEWDRFNAIAEDAKHRVAQEVADWRQNYSSRLSEARQVILRERSGRFLEVPAPAGSTNDLTPEALDRQADQRIRWDHQSRLAAIHRDEIDQYRDLRAAIRARDANQDFAKQDFNQVRGRQSNPNRTGPSRN